MNNLNNWKEVTKGLYRYVIGANIAYEIHILFWYHDTDILTAQASLFIVGEYNGTKTERECILSEQPVCNCLEAAVCDYNSNVLNKSFEVGKYYKHIGTKELMHIIGETKSDMYGECLVGESSNKHDLLPIGKGEGYSQNWIEIEKEEWDRYFEGDDISTKTTEMVNVYGKWIPKRDVTNNSNYDNAVFNGEI